MKRNGDVLVAGATGFVGGRLVGRLVESGRDVRCLVRHPELLHPGAVKGARILKGDVLSGRGLAKTLEGCGVAYYLVHSMASSVRDFAALDAQAADKFARAASRAGVSRIIYLGGLGRSGKGLSRHLQSRQEVGRILAGHGVPVTEFRAGVIVGSGSVSFEVIRHLMERLPFVPVFPCLKTRCHPIAVRDVLSYLVETLEKDASVGKTFEIGGKDILTYEAMMRGYAKIKGLRKPFFNLPCRDQDSCAGCARWVGWLTPVDRGYAQHLLESLKSEVVCEDRSALSVFDVKPMDYESALRLAFKRIKAERSKLSLSTLLFPRRTTLHSLRVNEGMIFDERVVEVDAPVEELFRVYSGIGGERGWFYKNWMWTLRGAVDRLLGGVGMRRGRAHRDELREGERLDFWRVERIIEGRLLLLRAEMKLPGPGWLQFESLPVGRDRSLLRQTAYFMPGGFFGNLYWNALYPVHKAVFSGLAAEIAKRARKLSKRRS